MAVNNDKSATATGVDIAEQDITRLLRENRHISSNEEDDFSVWI